MSYQVENRRCPILKEKGVKLNQSGFSITGEGIKTNLEERNAIKKLCTECQLEHCVYDKKGVAV